MRKYGLFLALALGLIVASRLSAQSGSDLDLSTRNMGIPPTHATVDSVARWIENPLDLKVTIAVTNLYANADDYLEIDICGQRQIFYGAGTDELGHYIPTNYPPVIVNAVLRREYPMSIMCPNSGPQGSPLFKWEDFNSPDSYIYNITNGTSAPEVSAFIWSNFTAQACLVFTNDDPNIDPTYLQNLKQTNLVVEMNRIISTMSFYTNELFVSYTNSDPIPGIMATNPTGQQICYVNRLLLANTISFPSPTSAPDNSGTAKITFGVTAPLELKIKKNKSAPNYTVLLNRDSSAGGVLNLANTGTGYASTNYSTLEILKDKFGHFGLGDGCDDATKAPGQGSWLSMGPGCTQDTNRIALDWHVSLGRTFDGLAAGQLAFREPGLTRSSYTPFALYYNGSMTNLYATETMLDTNLPSYITNADDTITTNLFIPVLSQNIWTNGTQTFTNCLVPVVLLQSMVPYTLTNSAATPYTNYDSVIRQVKGCQTFVDILTPDTNQTVLKFYHASDVGWQRDFTGLYTNFTGSPFVTYTIQNPEPATANKLNIIESRNGNSNTQSLVKATSAGTTTWTLTLGTGPEQRVEIREVSFTGGAVPTDRIEQDKIFYYSSPSSPSYQCQETYHSYPWGWELKETSIPNSLSNLVTTYEYYDNVNNPETYSLYGNGQIKQIKYPDGYWEKRIYENMGDNVWIEGLVLPGVLDYVVNPYLDADGSEGEATSPENATPYNSIYTKYAIFWGEGAVGQGRLSTKVDGLHNLAPIGNMWETGYFPNDNSWMTGWNAEAPCSESTAWTPYCESDPANMYGSRTATYSAAAPLGLSGKPYKIVSLNGPANPDKIYYYDFGVFISSGNIFVLDSSNHLFISASLNQYPDCRETEYSFGLNGLDNYQTLEDHSYYQLTPLKTVRNTRIFHLGNLTLSERFIYLGAGVTNEFTENPQWAPLFGLRYYIDSLGRTTNVIQIDRASGNSRVLYSADYRGATGYDGPLLFTEIDENGAAKSYAYDSLQRVATVTVKGFAGQLDRITQYKYDANGQVIQQNTSAGSLTQTVTQTFDASGRQTNIVNIDGISIGTTYSANNRVVTKTYPGGISTIQERYLDRRQKNLQGNGAVNQFFYYTRYSAPGGGCLGANFAWPETIQYLAAMNSPRWKASGQDLSGFDALNIWPLGGGSTNTGWSIKEYNNGFLWDTIASPGFPSEQYYYDQCGNVDADQLTLSLGDMAGVFGYGGGGEADLAYRFQDTSRIKTISDSLPVQIGGSWFQATTNYSCLTDNSNVRTVASIHLEQLNGFTGNTIGFSKDFDADNNETDTTTTLDRANNKITVTTSQPNTSSLDAATVYQNGRPISSSTLSVASPTQYKYDALGRTNEIISPLGYHAYINFDPTTGWVTSQTDFTGQTTSYQYYSPTEANAGKLKCQTSASGKKTYYAYTTRGELYRTWGDVPYPAEYRYSEYGDLTNLITYRSGSGWTSSTWPGSPGTGDNTYWQYDEASGALLKKIDAQGRFVSYSYSTNTGQLLTRSWGRTTSVTNEDNSVSTVAVTVTNSYNGFGDLTAQEYNDGTPNVYFNNYNRAGQPREIIDGSGTNELAYDHASRLVASYCNGGLLNGITVSNHFNPYYGRDAVAVLGLGTDGTDSLEDDYGYDACGRLGSVSSGNCSASYGYVANSDLLQSTTFKNGSSTVLTTTRAWDYGIRLHSIANVVDSTPVTSHSYQYDALNRRTQATLEDGSLWQYGYDDRDELTSANRKWATAPAPVSGQQFSYAYDTIGNRKTAAYGGNTNGVNLRTITYTNNSLNQYVGISTPGFENIIGAALATNSVTVNGGLADRKGEYFHREVSVANTSQPVWQNVTNIAGTFTNKGGLVFPANGQTLAYDADGNLSADGIWTYQWDAENRLISMAMTGTVANLAATNRLRLDFAYDFMGRRVQKIVSVWNVATNDFVSSATNRFVYDGWNLLAVVNPQSAILQSFVWGKDLSGTIMGVGGVGGLLLASISGTDCFATYDGNGNITSLINASDKSLAARYEYSPYGELLRETGLLAHQNPFRFSTKFGDEESGLVYYGYRCYSPALGKWICRDPSGENGGIHLYQFSKNSPVQLFDPNGCDPTSLQTLSVVGPEAAYADLCYVVSSFCVPGPNSIMALEFQTAAMETCLLIDSQLGGKLLQNIGGPAAFTTSFAVGNQMGMGGFTAAQSLDAAVVAGRLGALEAIGAGAKKFMAGETPEGSYGSSDRLGYDFARDLARGDTAYGSLDAALLGNSIGLGMIDTPEHLAWTTAAFTSSLLNRDAAGAFSNLPEYNALNAWDMAEALQE